MTECEICEGLREEIKELNEQMRILNGLKGLYEGRSDSLTNQVELQGRHIKDLIEIIKIKHTP